MKDIRAKFLIVEEAEEFTITEHDYESFVKALQKNLTAKTVIVGIEEEEYDDPYDLILEYTEPYEDMTIEKAEELMEQMKRYGCNLPTWITAKDFVEMYKDCEPIEKE